MGISFQDIPPELRAQLEAEYKDKPKSKNRVTAWKDIPASWKTCRPHGWAGFGGECLYCPERDGERTDGESEQNREH